jgi:hypothetical protein
MALLLVRADLNFEIEVFDRLLAANLQLLDRNISSK